MLKRESRILGLSGASIGDAVILVGVIFRGSLWLDGVVAARIPADTESYSVEIANMVKASKQFSQLHALIISPLLLLQVKLQISELGRRIRLPVIAVTKPTQLSSTNQHAQSRSFTIAINRAKRAIAFTGTSRDQAQQLYRIACNPENTLPEPVRVADMLAKQFRRRSENAENMN